MGREKYIPAGTSGKKREALENILVPYKLLENRELLLRSGFRYCDAFFKWYNFSGLIAVK
jgi:tRNA (cmo5U34)-methyltransferase